MSSKKNDLRREYSADLTETAHFSSPSHDSRLAAARGPGLIFNRLSNERSAGHERNHRQAASTRAVVAGGVATSLAADAPRSDARRRPRQDRAHRERHDR